MPDAAPPTPFPFPANFDLRASSIGGSGRGVALDGESIAWRDRDGPRRRRFDEVSTIDFDCEMDGDQPDARCDVGFADGLTMTVHWDGHTKNGEVERYLAFVTALIERLGPDLRARILFREGARPAKRIWMIIVFAAMLTLSSGAFLYGLVSPETYAQPNGWMLLPLTLFFVAATGFGLWAAMRSGQAPIDPLNIPARALPPRPKGS
jgi:hypothetical protein